MTAGQGPRPVRPLLGCPFLSGRFAAEAVGLFSSGDLQCLFSDFTIQDAEGAHHGVFGVLEGGEEVVGLGVEGEFDVGGGGVGLGVGMGVVDGD